MKTEDDILHLSTSELPTFGNVLKPADSERFLSFLTAPYIRIPLILDFFANGDPGRLAGLRSKALQLIVDAALFEPGRWRAADFTEFVKEIPVVDEEQLQKLMIAKKFSMYLMYQMEKKKLNCSKKNKNSCIPYLKIKSSQIQV